MASIALQLIAESINIDINSQESIVFDVVRYASDSVSYNPATGEITLFGIGSYTAHWWVATQSVSRSGGASLALVSNQGSEQIEYSPIKTGEVYGFGVFEVTEGEPVTISLKNITDGTMFLSTDEPVKASLILNYDVLPAFGFFFTPYRTSHWAIESGNNFVFYENGPSVNVEHDPVSSEVTVLLSGTYEISYVFSFIEPANILISLLKNNVPVHTIPLANFTGALSDTIVLPLSAGDVLKWEFEFLEED